jgi:hypothetical protein
MGKLIDRTNQRYGRLTAHWPTGKIGNGPAQTKVVWLCSCDCGALTVVSSPDLASQHTQSCGCLESYTRSALPKIFNRIHGRSHTSEYMSYIDAKRRCTDPTVHSYPRYGGRGIKFLFTSFEQWFAELGSRPIGKTVDRIRNDEHYAPGNVRWATPKEQRHNQSAGRKCRDQA